MTPITTCPHCAHFHSGHLDRGTNWMECAKGHRLVAEEALALEHHLHYNLEEQTIHVTHDGWAVREGSGEAMLGRTDCPDWQVRAFRLDLGNPEYD